MQCDISIIIVTKNLHGEALSVFEQTLCSVEHFEDVWVVHSGEESAVRPLTEKYKAHFVPYEWDGCYPKKRQYCLDTLPTKYKWIFFLDADELMFPDLTHEIAHRLAHQDNAHIAGFFVKGGYIWEGQPLKYGLKNNKLCLLHKERMAFPVIDDLGCKSMGEIEGHYQPLIKDSRYKIGQLKTSIDHYAFIDMQDWDTRHQKYARWEAHMIRHNAYPKESSWVRETMKYIFRRLPCRALCALLHSYCLKKGVLDGRAGFHFAKTRYRYYAMVSKILRSERF